METYLFWFRLDYFPGFHHKDQWWRLGTHYAHYLYFKFSFAILVDVCEHFLEALWYLTGGCMSSIVSCELNILIVRLCNCSCFEKKATRFFIPSSAKLEWSASLPVWQKSSSTLQELHSDGWVCGMVLFLSGQFLLFLLCREFLPKDYKILRKILSFRLERTGAQGDRRPVMGCH